MEAASFSETLVTLYQTTCRHIPEERTLRNDKNESLKYHSKSSIYIQTEAKNVRFGIYPVADRTRYIDHRLINSLIWARSKLRLFC
jgi:hypothetical protein